MGEISQKQTKINKNEQILTKINQSWQNLHRTSTYFVHVVCRFNSTAFAIQRYMRSWRVLELP